MKATQDYYAILGVSPDANSADIKAAYRQAVRRFHPDANPNPGAVVQFQGIAEAYEVLSDDYRRAEYDRTTSRQGTPPPYFHLNLTPSKRALKTLQEPQVLYVLVEIMPDARFAQKDGASAPLNLVLAIDRSTSMRGARLDKVKQAVHRIIDSLEPKDRLGLISFSDRAEIVFESSPVLEKPRLKAMASTMQASGGTEIFHGMLMAANQVRQGIDRQYVNHLILLTDGQTYGDEDKCLALADELNAEGIGVSAIGIGEEWNDAFLDDLASRTGGVSEYINSPSAVERFLNNRIRSLGAAFIERLQLSVAPDTDVKLEDAFKLNPNAQPLPVDVKTISLGTLERHKSISVILQLQLPPLLREGFRDVLRLNATGDVLHEEYRNHQAISDFSIEVSGQGPQENPPTAILEALGKLTLYRMQSRAHEALSRGDYREATRKLENLATRLIENGEEALAHAALAEARRVARTTMLSEEGRKHLKYGTRALLLSGQIDNDETTQIASKDVE